MILIQLILTDYSDLKKLHCTKTYSDICTTYLLRALGIVFMYCFWVGRHFSPPVFSCGSLSYRFGWRHFSRHFNVEANTQANFMSS